MSIASTNYNSYGPDSELVVAYAIDETTVCSHQPQVNRANHRQQQLLPVLRFQNEGTNLKSIIMLHINKSLQAIGRWFQGIHELAGLSYRTSEHFYRLVH